MFKGIVLQNGEVDDDPGVVRITQTSVSESIQPKEKVSKKSKTEKEKEVVAEVMTDEV